MEIINMDMFEGRAIKPLTNCMDLMDCGCFVCIGCIGGCVDMCVCDFSWF